MALEDSTTIGLFRPRVKAGLLEEAATARARRDEVVPAEWGLWEVADVRLRDRGL